MKVLRWLFLVILVLALILVPFLLFGAQIETWTRAFIEKAEARPLLSALVLGGFLAGDVVLPVPSSILSTGCGVLLGIAAGTLVSFIGMTISCVFGFALGRLARPLAGRLLGANEAARLARIRGRFGDWMIVITRPVPVLAEAAVLFAGMGRMRARRFMLLTTLANLGISLVYATIGALSATVNSFLLAFIGAIVLPGILMMITRQRTSTEAKGTGLS